MRVFAAIGRVGRRGKWTGQEKEGKTGKMDDRHGWRWRDKQDRLIDRVEDGWIGGKWMDNEGNN